MSKLTPQEIQNIFDQARAADSRPNFVGMDLSGLDLSRLDLSEADFVGANLERVNLIEANLSQSDLSRANLGQADLIGANLVSAILAETRLAQANLIGANMVEAMLNGADLNRADLSGVNLNAAKLNRANLNRAELIGSNLMRSDFSQADLSGADLSGTNLIKADLRGANLSGARLIEADLSRAVLSYTLLVDVDLRQTRGLERVVHQGPSPIDARTLYRSRGFIAETFLRGVGVPDDLIKHTTGLNGDAPQYFSCFISYADPDQPLAVKLFDDLQQRGVRCWHVPESLKDSSPFSPTTEETIRVCDKLLLIFSEHSLKRPWIAQEVEAALARERKLDQIILFPIRLDEALFQIDDDWTQPLHHNRNIHDFSNWQQKSAYQKSFERLLRHLKARHE